MATISFKRVFYGYTHPAEQNGTAEGHAVRALVAVWDKGSVPDGQISIPVELNERLLPIRDDLAAWTYERLRPDQRQTAGRTPRADDNLSMWWCSTLVEKHPKVTHTCSRR